MRCPSAVPLLGAQEASADSGSSSHGSQTREAGPLLGQPLQGLTSPFHPAGTLWAHTTLQSSREATPGLHLHGVQGPVGRPWL